MICGLDPMESGDLKNILTASLDQSLERMQLRVCRYILFSSI